MFKKNEDRHFIEILVEVNLTDASEWKKSGGDISLTDRGYWKDVDIETYKISVIPNGSEGNIFFHHRADQFSKFFDGLDRLRDNERPDLHMGNYCKIHDIYEIEWGLTSGIFGGLFSVYLDGKLLLFAPTGEFFNLQKNGRTSSDELNSQCEHPCGIDESGNVVDSFHFHKSLNRERVCCSNQLASVSAKLNDQTVFY